MQFKRQISTIILTFSGFASYYFIRSFFFGSLRDWFYGTIGSFGVGHIIAYAIVGIPIYFATYLIPSKEILKTKLGFSRSLITAVLYAAACVLPMFIGFAFLFPFNSKVEINVLLVKVIAAGFFEELFFRAFLFGMLFKYTRLGFIPSILLGSLVFGIGHMYQSSDPMELLGIFGITFMGAVIFGWAFVEWKFNIWVPIFLHMLMNLAWELFGVSDNALGDIYANIFRLLTILLIFIVTIIYKKKKEIPFKINSSTIWIDKRKKALESSN